MAFSLRSNLFPAHKPTPDPHAPLVLLRKETIMKSASQLLSLLGLALVAGAVASPAQAMQMEYSYPAQKQIEARSVWATHSMHTAPYAMSNIEVVADAVIHFSSGSDKLTPAAEVEVKKIAAVLRSPHCRASHVTVNGYTDSKGKSARNQRLSYHRALNVVHALTAHGVPASMLSAQGFGEESPVADNATAGGRAANRRVTFTVSSY